MKAHTVPVEQSDTPQTVIQRIIAVRFAELLARSPALTAGGTRELHDMRIACKRLRYVLETFSAQVPHLSRARQALRTMQDTLGELHDCDILASAATRYCADLVYARLLRDRARLLLSARALWKNGLRPGGDFAGLIVCAGLGSR